MGHRHIFKIVFKESKFKLGLTIDNTNLYFNFCKLKNVGKYCLVQYVRSTYIIISHVLF